VVPTGGLRVQLLGAFRVELPDGNVATVWSRPSGRRLFQVILLREGRRVGREELAEFLFPDLAPARAANAVSKALSIARSALAPFDVLGADRDVIWIDGPIDIDLERTCAFLRHGLSLPPGDDRDAELTAGLACEGRLLDQELYADWAIAPRDELESLRSHGALQLARDRSAGHGRQSLPSVVEAWRRVHARDQSNEEACITLMGTYGALGQRDQVAAMFHRTVAAIDRLALQVPEALKASYDDAMATASTSGRTITLKEYSGPAGNG
jgi:DNA-binding SARP family transcriptional activator